MIWTTLKRLRFKAPLPAEEMKARPEGRVMDCTGVFEETDTMSIWVTLYPISQSTYDRAMASDGDAGSGNEITEQYETGGTLEDLRRNAVDSRLATQERLMSTSDGMHEALDGEDAGQ